MPPPGAAWEATFDAEAKTVSAREYGNICALWKGDIP
jgi:hypothetical protein